MKHSFVHRFALSTVGAMLGLALYAVTPAQAIQSNWDWAYNDYVGYCAQVDGGFVLTAQAVLMDSGNYSGPVDNDWGSNSDAALKNYQFNRLGSGQDDGCAGPITWSAMGYDVSDGAGVAGCPDSSIWFWPGQSVINRSYLYNDGVAWSANSGYQTASPVLQQRNYYFDPSLILNGNTCG